MFSEASLIRNIREVSGLVAKRPVGFFMLLLAFILIPSMQFFVFLPLAIWLLPVSYLLCASAYYNVSIAQMIADKKEKILPVVLNIVMHTAGMIAVMGLFWAVDGKGFEATLYPFAGDAVRNAWFRFCDKFPLELVLLLATFWFTWPAAGHLIFKESGRGSSLSDKNAEVFNHLGWKNWLWLAIVVCGLGYGWYMLTPILYAQKTSVIWVIGYAVVLLFLTGVSFFYGLSIYGMTKEEEHAE